MLVQVTRLLADKRGALSLLMLGLGFAYLCIIGCGIAFTREWSEPFLFVKYRPTHKVIFAAPCGEMGSGCGYRGDEDELFNEFVEHNKLPPWTSYLAHGMAQASATLVLLGLLLLFSRKALVGAWKRRLLWLGAAGYCVGVVFQCIGVVVLYNARIIGPILHISVRAEVASTVILFFIAQSTVLWMMMRRWRLV